MIIDLNAVTGFDWDRGNERKSVEKHAVSQKEAEEAFFNQPLLTMPDHLHSGMEPRFHLLGAADDGRKLHITFTLRRGGTLIRIISARDMSQKERSIHGKAS